MEQFNLSVWLKDKSRKLVTRDGRPARIVCWDRNTKYWKIVGLVTSPDGSTENPFTYDVNGNESDGCLHDHRNDLFFTDEEDELTNLQKTLEEDCDCYVNLYNDGKTREELREWIKGWCPRIIDLARKEIEKLNPYSGNQKQEWSEEDEKLYTSALWHIKNSCGNGGKDSGEYEVYNWLKSIKDRVQPQPKQELKEQLIDLARKELEKENSEFKPKFTYNETDYSELANKLIEFRNNTPLCSVSYRDGEGRKIILHYEKEILDLAKKELSKDLPKWKRSNSFFNTGNKFELGKTSLRRFDGYEIPYSELEKLPK